MMKKFLAMLSVCVLLTAPAYAIERDAEMDAMLEAQMGVSVDNVLAALDGYSPKIEEVDHYMAEIARTRDVLHYLLCLVYDQTGYPMPAPTLEGLSYDQLVSYRDALNLAIWNSQEWQEVKVPAGIWVIGEDIPAGHWTVSAPDGESIHIAYGDELNSTGRSINTLWTDVGMFANLYGQGHYSHNDDNDHYLNIDMKKGYYFSVDEGYAIFTPYAGKPDLGFK